MPVLSGCLMCTHVLLQVFTPLFAPVHPPCRSSLYVSHPTPVTISTCSWIFLFCFHILIVICWGLESPMPPLILASINLPTSNHEHLLEPGIWNGLHVWTCMFLWFGWEVTPKGSCFNTYLQLAESITERRLNHGGSGFISWLIRRWIQNLVVLLGCDELGGRACLKGIGHCGCVFERYLVPGLFCSLCFLAVLGWAALLSVCSCCLNDLHYHRR